LLNLPRLVDAQAREVILRKGDLHHGIFGVLSGSIEVIRAAGVSETILHVLVAENSLAT
jgi:CRP-like cAMP-binding protein